MTAKFLASKLLAAAMTVNAQYESERKSLVKADLARAHMIIHEAISFLQEIEK